MKEKGFTLIELLAIITILTLIALVSVPAVLNTLRRSKEKSILEYQNTIKQAAELYVERNIDSFETLSQVGGKAFVSTGTLMDENYLDNKLTNPEDDTKVPRNHTVVVTVGNDMIKNYQYVKKDITEKGYVQDGLVTFYDGYHTGSDTWKDLSGHNNDGVLNQITFEKGYAVFNGNDSGISLGSSLSTLFNSGNTIEIVIWFDEDNVRDIIIGNFSSAGSINWERLTGNQGRLWFNAGAFESRTGNNFLMSNRVYSLSLLFDKANNKAYIYRNSELGYTFTSELFSTYSGDYSNVWIGRDGRTGATVLKGRVYSVRIYNRALSKDEIQQNYNIDSERFGI